MSYINVYPSRINWENEPNISTPINATNLNKADYALYAIDQTLAGWDTSKANESDLLLCVKTIDYDTSTGVFVFTWQNGTTKTIDLNIEKIPVSFSMDANGVITMTTEDGTTYTADVGALIKTYTFTDSAVIDFTVTTDASGNKTVTADIVDGSITGQKLQPNYLADCQTAATNSSNSATAAASSNGDSEAWAVGTRGGIPVPSTDPAYNNNSYYWSQHGASNSLAGLTDVTLTTPSNGEVLTYDSTSQEWVNAPSVASNSLAGLTDVTLTTPQDGEVLTYDSTNQEWVNAPSAGGGTASNVSYDNTTSGMTATNVQDAIDELDTEKASTTEVDNIHKVTTLAVDLTGWTSDTTSQSGTTLYKKQISLTNVYVSSPSMDIGAGTGYVLPTSAEQESYNLLQYVTVDDTVPYLYLYASAIPTTAFYIKVTGVD